jgi:integrase
VASIDRWKGNRWRARWRTPEGESRSQIFDRKVDAEKHLISVEHSKYSGTYIDSTAGRIGFGEFADAWLEAQTFDASTREAVASRLKVHIKPTFGSTELRAIRPSTVQAWVRGRQEKCSPRYVRVMLANLSSILGAAVEDGLIPRNPCASSAVRAPSVEQSRIVPWTNEQVQAVIAALPEAYRAIAVVAAGAGLRQGEVFGLRVEDIDFLGRRLLVRQQIKIVGNKLIVAPPKGGKVREVPLADPVGEAIAERLRQHPAGEDGLIFTSREHGMMNRTYFNARIWKPALKKAGIPQTRANGMHALRHYFASVLLDAGESVRALADYLGHSDPGFTLRVYTHLMPASADRARKAVEAAFAADSSRVTLVSRDTA